MKRAFHPRGFGVVCAAVGSQPFQATFRRPNDIPDPDHLAIGLPSQRDLVLAGLVADPRSQLGA